jgi:hypothetical protein
MLPEWSTLPAPRQKETAKTWKKRTNIGQLLYIDEGMHKSSL